MNAPYGFTPGGPAPAYAHNPYAAPQAGFRAPGPSGPVAYTAHSGALKWAYLGTLVGGILLAVLGGVVQAAADEPGVGIAFLILGMMLMFFGRLVVALIWVYAAWSAVPADYRVTSSGKRVSPGEAVGFLFIPFYNLYWMFVASGGLCDALDYLLRSAGSYKTAPKGLSLAACICQFVPYANLLIAPFLWFFYMWGVDSAAEALQTASASGGAQGGPQGFGGYGGPPPAGGFGAPAYGPPPGY